MTNPTCATCLKGLNLINGRYCTELGAYVEYATLTPPCQDDVLIANALDRINLDAELPEDDINNNQ